MTNFANPLNIPGELLNAVYRQAREEFPAECCGWLTGPAGGDGVDAIRPAENAQDIATHPTVDERTAERAYVFSSTDLIALNRSFDYRICCGYCAIERPHTPARVIYHSHPNGQAYFSDTDREVATSPWGDEPAYPVQQLVVGVNAERVVEAALFGWDDDAGGFVELARYEGAAV